MLLELWRNKIGQLGQVKVIAGQDRAKVDSRQFSQIRVSRLGKGLLGEPGCLRDRLRTGPRQSLEGRGPSSA